MTLRIFTANKKYIVMATVLAMLVCSFFWSDYETDRNSDTGSLPMQASYCRGNVGVDEIVMSEGLSVSFSQAAIIRPVSVRRCGSFSFRMDSFAGFFLSARIFSFSFFIILYRCLCNNTHVFIVNYIHNKDGGKS